MSGGDPALPHPSRTIVIGMGNPLLGDDGVGWAVADAMDARLATLAPSVELERLAVGGLALMERLVGFDRAILVDALVGGNDRLGTVSVRPLAALDRGSAAHLDSSHDASLMAALEAGHGLGARLPGEILVVGIAAQYVERFGEGLSAAVAAAVDTAAGEVLRLLGAS
ncbi:MAG TPA: hydrogenase maturation protease [Candidatus Binatus sp.]|nr:hydrogenase maturation protease [Candidatus Binatus sp.]